MKFRVISSADITICPLRSLSPHHYRDDGTCLCVPDKIDRKRRTQFGFVNSKPAKEEIK